MVKVSTGYTRPLIPALLVLALCLALFTPVVESRGGGRGGGGRGGFRGAYRSNSRLKARSRVGPYYSGRPVASASSGWKMSGIALIFLLLALIAIFCGLYFVSWCLCGLQKSRKEGHYILESEDEYNNDCNRKLYSGLDMVDEANNLKNPAEFSTIDEKKIMSDSTSSSSDHVPSAPDHANPSEEEQKQNEEHPAE